MFLRGAWQWDCQPCRVSGGWGTSQKGHEKWQDAAALRPLCVTQGGQKDVKADLRLLGVPSLDPLSTHHRVSPESMGLHTLAGVTLLPGV